MKILLIFFTFYLISGAVKDIDVTGYSGGRVLVDSGKLWFSDFAKYMAKILEWRTIINDKKNDKLINEGRFTLFRNNEGNLMIYIRELNTHDAGRYAIEVLHNWRIYMTLNVEEDSCCNVSKRVMVNIGETAAFSCEYSQNHINDPKIIFKEGRDSIEMIYSTWRKKERFSVSDDKHKLMTVRITAVTPDDGGVYLCGVWIDRHSYSYSIINTVHLHIIVSDFSMIIIIAVCVILLLIGGFTLTVCKLRHKRRGDAHTHRSVWSSQLPTIPSEELLYTSVSFQKHEESLNDATGSFSKDHSDYTTVIYHTRLN